MLERARAKLAADPRWPHGSSLSRAKPSALPFADARVRPPHLHLPAALRRRSGGDAARAGAGGEARRAESPASSSASRAGSGSGPGGSTPGSGCRRSGRLASRQWFEVGRFLGPSIEGFYRSYPLRAPARALGGGGDRRRQRAADEPRRWRRDLGHRWRLSRAPPRLLRPAPGRLARPGHRPAPALHALARQQRRDRGGGRAARLRRPPRRGDRRLLPRGRGRRSRDRRAPRPAARHPALPALADRACRRRPGRGAGDRHRRHDRRLADAGARWSSPAASSPPPTTSSGSAAASTPTSGWPPRGAASPLSPAGGSTPSALHSVGEAIAAAAAVLACFWLSVAQRRLSTPVRELRRRTVAVEGEQRLADGTSRQLDRASLAAPLDGALRALSIAVPLLAIAAVALRV